MRSLVAQAGLASRIEVESAGTAAYHVGDPPDARSTAHARRRGVALTGAGRQFVAEDFARFDYVLAMDTENHAALARLARSLKAVEGAASRLHLCRDFDPGAPRGASVPDPYYGGDAGFEEVLDQCQAACEGLLAHIRQSRGL